MLQVTDRAIAQLTAMREESRLEADRGIGLVPDEGGRLQFASVEPGPTDQVIERAGDPIMVVPATLSEALDGMVLDCGDGPAASQFTLMRPDDGGTAAPAGAGPDYHD